jgi:hypothetical protein
MHITITSIRLRSPWKFFALSCRAMKIMFQLNKTGALKKDTWGIWTLHYTITAWNTHQELKDFAKSGPHLDAMKAAGDIAGEIRTYTYESDEFPSRSEAKKLLLEKGRAIAYRAG